MAERPADNPDPSRQSLDARWWWSSSLPVIVGVVVIGFQVNAYREGGGIPLNAVMIAVGAAVAIWGLLAMRKDYAAYRAAQQQHDDGPSTPPN